MSVAATIGFYCPSCSRYAIHPVPGERSVARCGSCQGEVTLEPSLSLEACPLCQNREFFSRKDLPQQVGCAAVVLTVVLSSVAYALWGAPASFVVLGLATVVDFILYHRLPEVVVCYRCQSELRGFPTRPEIRPFDIGRAEEYEQGR